MRQFLCLGDSLTQQGFDPAHIGWVGILSNTYIRRAEFTNRGLSGYNTRWIQQLLPQIKASLIDGIKFDLGILLLGANDNAEGPQHVPIIEFPQRLEAIITYMRDELRCDKIMVMGCPPFFPSKFDNRSDERHEQYSAAAGNAAKATGSVFINLHQEIKARLGDEWKSALQEDGLHLSVTGNRVIAELVTRTIEKEIPCLAVQELPFQFPLWDQMPPYASS